MGTYTTNLKFYKPDATEFVDVDTQLNRNWDIADRAVRRLMEYEYSSLAVPDISDDVTRRARFFKIYSNTVIAYFKSSQTWYQDPKAFVSTWKPALSFFSEGYNFAPSGLTPYYRVVATPGGGTTQIEWCGAFFELGGAMELNLNTTVIPAGGIPTEARPAVSKYFDVWCGNTSTDFSIARLLFGADGSLQFKRYGVNPSSGTSDENRVELTGVRYNVEVTGT